MKPENRASGFESRASVSTESDLLSAAMIKYLNKHFSSSAKRKEGLEGIWSLFILSSSLLKQRQAVVFCLMSRWCGESAVDEISDPGLWRGTASVWELNICHRVWFWLRVAHQGVRVCVFPLLQTVFKARTFFGFVLNYNYCQTYNIWLWFFKPWRLVATISSFSRYLHVSKSHKTAWATELLKLIDCVAK